MKTIFVILIAIVTCFENVCTQDHIAYINSGPSLSSYLIKGAQRIKNNFITDEESCMLCEEVIDNILALRRSKASKEVMKHHFYQLCLLYTEWGEEGCKGRAELETDTILYIIDNKPDFKPARFCAIRFQQYGCLDPNADDWIVVLPPIPPKPTFLNKRKKNQKSKQDNSDAVNILQITDVHLDSLYTPGSNSKCSEPLCCESGTPASPEDAAGYWGNYNVCDMPWHTMENMLDRIRQKHFKHVDWIYFTGDIVSHRSWASSIELNSESISLMFNLLEKAFPNKTIFPILGNHEAHPADCYASDGVNKSSNVSTQWLLDLSANEWSKWLPNATHGTIRKGGYYTVLVKPGFRIIALNSNVCFTSNLWLLYDNRDTYGQLKWLVDVLTEAEKNGEKVHILSHVPVSDAYSSCVKVWSREFRRIVLRFSDTIVAQFNGHTHYDEFKLYFDPNSSSSKTAKAVAYNGASFASFIGSNPNYRIYEVDYSNMTVTDYSEYTFNLTAANSKPNSSPSWYKLYSFKEAYGLPDLTLNSLTNLHQQFSSNNSDNALVERYFRYMYRDSDAAIKEGCDSACKKRLVCLIAAGDTTDAIRDC